jgi:hypothetical protein
MWLWCNGGMLQAFTDQSCGSGIVAITFCCLHQNCIACVCPLQAAAAVVNMCWNFHKVDCLL